MAAITGAEPAAPRTFVQQELLIGLIPEQNIFKQRERYQHLKEYLFETLGSPLRLRALRRYGNIIEHFRDEKLDGAFFGSFTYGLARHQLGVEPLVTARQPRRNIHLPRLSFCAKGQSDPEGCRLKGKAFRFRGAGNDRRLSCFPLPISRNRGIHDIHSYIGETFFAGSHDAAILAVLNGKPMRASRRTPFSKRWQLENPRIEKELVILATSGVVPQNCLAVRKDLDPELKKALKEALLEMDKTSAGEDTLKRFGARGFIETRDSDYAYFYQLSSQVGINLKTYRYDNR